MIFYKCFKAVLRVLLIPLFRVKVIGRERLCTDCGCILYANHLSAWDPVFMHLALNIKPRFMAKKELFEKPVLKGIITYFGAFPVDRGKGDFSAFKNAFTIADEGGVIGIFPEGTRSKGDISVKRFQPGAAIIAVRTGAKVCPMYISGKLRPFKRTYLVFGEPFVLAAEGEEIKLSESEKVREAADRMRSELISLKEEIPS